MKKKMIIGLIILSAIAAVILYCTAGSAAYKAEVTKTAMSFGLEDIQVSAQRRITDGLWEAKLTSSNFESLSYEQMISLDKQMRGLVVYIQPKQSGLYAAYSIYPSTSTIYRNGEKIYDNYYGSDSYKKASRSSSSALSGNNFTTVSSDDDNFWYAVAAAQNLVKDQLSVPSSAKFPVGASEYKVTRNNAKYTVSGYVDSDNLLGVTGRETWSATFTMGNTSGEQYTVSNYSVVFD